MQLRCLDWSHQQTAARSHVSGASVFLAALTDNILSLSPLLSWNRQVAGSINWMYFLDSDAGGLLLSFPSSFVFLNSLVSFVFEFFRLTPCLILSRSFLNSFAVRRFFEFFLSPSRLPRLRRHYRNQMRALPCSVYFQDLQQCKHGSGRDK